MDFKNFLHEICGDEIPKFLGLDFFCFFQLLFYSYLPIVIISLLISVYIHIKDKKSLQSKLLLLFTSFFFFFLIDILVQWVSSYHIILMFGWQLTAFFEVGIYLSIVYFSYVFLLKKDIPDNGKILLISVITLIAVLTPTVLNIKLYDINNCEGVVGGLWRVIYLIELASTVLIGSFGYLNYKKTKEAVNKRQTLIYMAGVLSFLVIFFISNFYAEVTKVYEFNLWGPLGMLVFIIFLSYLIIKYKVFNLKLIGSNVLVLSLWILTGSLLTIQDINVSHAVTAVTLIVSIIFGLILINSVRKEVGQREKIEKLASDLTSANARLLELDKQKSEFVSFATHQLRAPLTAMKGYTSLILEGEMGDINSEVRKATKRIFDSSSTLENIVDDYLNISRIELGTIKYSFEVFDFKDLVNRVIEDLRPSIENKGLKFSFSTDPSTPDTRFMVRVDKDKFKQVISNLIDNSVKYTPSGSLDISLTRRLSDRKIQFSIKDTGVGISPAVMPKLFAKFVRADNANKQNIFGTGLGLYIANQIVLAHKGRLWAESKGEGKGSQFYLELDMEV